MTKEEIVKEAQEQVNYCTPLYPECFIQGYLAGAEPRENKIADIKANCDLAIEGRDIKIKELELELTVEKDQLQEEINLHLHAEDYIKSLEKENKTLEGCLLAEQEHTQMLEQQIEKLKADLNNAIESASKWYVADPVYSMLVDIYNDNFEIIKGGSN